MDDVPAPRRSGDDPPAPRRSGEDLSRLEVEHAALQRHAAELADELARLRATPGVRIARAIDTRTKSLRQRVPRRGTGAMFAITVAAPNERVAPRWGDWHLAEALAAALERGGGGRAEVRTANRSVRQPPAAGTHVVVRGRQPVHRSGTAAHVLWVISHPELITDDELDEADLVLAASERLATAFAARTTTPVEVLLQATDHRRFAPRSPEPRHAHPLAVVAKSRGVLRPAVRDALDAGLRPAIYGSGWDGLVDPALIVAPYIANDELPAVYSSVGVLLNDHWETMRLWGIVSNRLFDAVACECAVISDHLDEVDALFEGRVPTYRSPGDLAELVAGAHADPDATRSAAREARAIVLGAHTFDHRARELLVHLSKHGLAPRGDAAARHPGATAQVSDPEPDLG